MTADTNYTVVSLAEVSRLVANDLKRAYPDVSFRRKSSSRGGYSLDLFWQDGPTEAEMRAITNCYEGWRTETRRYGLVRQDVKVPRIVPGPSGSVSYQVDSIFLHRSYSEAFLSRVVDTWCACTGDPAPQVRMNGGQASLETLYLDPVCVTDEIMARARRISAKALSTLAFREDGRSDGEIIITRLCRKKDYGRGFLADMACIGVPDYGRMTGNDWLMIVPVVKRHSAVWVTVVDGVDSFVGGCWRLHQEKEHLYTLAHQNWQANLFHRTKRIAANRQKLLEKRYRGQ